MKTFWAFFRLEFKSFFSVRNIIIMSLFAAAAIYFTLIGIGHYTSIDRQKTEFQEVEAKKLESFQNWEQYGGYGMDIFFMPSKLSVFFHNSAPFTEMTAHLDVSERLNITKPFKGKKVFSENTGGYIDLAGFLLLFGGLISILFGYDTFRHGDYLKFLSSIAGHHRVLACLYISRLLLLSLFFIFIIGLSILTATFLLKDFPILHCTFNLLPFILLTLIIQYFFFLTGSIISSLRRNLSGILLIGSWVFFVYLMPTIINQSANIASGRIDSNYQSEIKKLEKLTAVQGNAAAKIRAEITPYIKLINYLNSQKITHTNELKAWLKNWKKTPGKSIDTKAVKRLGIWLEKLPGENKYINLQQSWLRYEITIRQESEGKEFLQEDFPEMHAVETKLLEKIKGHATLYRHLSMLFPTTHYSCTNRELSSRGFLNITAFFEYAIATKANFVKLNLENKKIPVQKFLKNQKVKLENVYKAKPIKPNCWGYGMIFTLGYLVLGIFFANHFLKRKLYPKPKKKEQLEFQELSDLELEISKGKFNVLFTMGDVGKAIRSQLYNILSGNPQKKTHMPGIVKLGEKEITASRTAQHFIYFCSPDQLPGDLRINEFMRFMGTLLNLPKKEIYKLKVKKSRGSYINDLNTEEKGYLILQAAKMARCGIFLFFQFTKGMSAHFMLDFKRVVHEIKEEKQVAVFYLTNDLLAGKNLGDMVYVHKRDSAFINLSF